MSPARLQGAPTGMALDFASGTPPAHWAGQVRGAGIIGVIVDTWNPAWAQIFTQNLAAGLGTAAFQGYLAAAWGTPSEAFSRAQAMVATLRAAGYPAGGDCWLDCEAMAISDAAAIAWITAWGETINQAGYTAKVYVGAGCPLTGQQWYDLGPITGYWRSTSNVPEVPTRGYQIIQTGTNQTEAGWLVDRDSLRTDAKGDVPRFAVPEVTPVVGPTAPTTPWRFYQVTVQAGQTLAGLAQTYGTSVAAIVDANGLPASVSATGSLAPYVGLHLMIPVL